MSVRELVVLSGKGGTGKTTVVGAFAGLAGRAVLVDCDVDAADLHLLLSPAVRERQVLRAGHVAIIDSRRCTGCGTCQDLCRFGAVEAAESAVGAPRVVDPMGCEGCGVCVDHCPSGAITFPERTTGEWYISDTRFGPMVHARLDVGAENSGKLVTTVRTAARELAPARDATTILVDGPPGIGCPVIASLTGASAALAVTEPTVSGEHDLDRLLDLCEHFSVPVSVCVNRWDVNPWIGRRIELRARARGARLVGRIPYDRSVVAAQVASRTLSETGGRAAEATRAVWQQWMEHLEHA